MFFIQRLSMWILSIITFGLSSSNKSSSQSIVHQKIKLQIFLQNLLEGSNLISLEMNLVFVQKNFWIKGGIVRNYDPKCNN